MKKILLSSAAIVAFAGAAAAEVSFSGSAKLGYNDDIEDGFYADADFDANATAELNNGWTAGASVGIEVSDLLETGGTKPNISTDDSYKIFIESDMGGLYFGDYDSATDQLSIGVEGLTDGMADYEDDDNLVLKAKFGGVEVGASASVGATVATPGAAKTDISQETFAVKGTFGSTTVSLGYDKDADAQALAAATTFGSANVEVGVAKVGADTNYGIEVGYPVGPVALTVWYADGDQARNMGIKAVYEDGPISVTAKVKDVDGASTAFNLEGTYDAGNGLKVGAGIVDGEGEYIGAKYDLGGGATFLAAYANGEVDGTTKDIGDAYDGDFELKDGLTLELSLSF